MEKEEIKSILYENLILGKRLVRIVKKYQTRAFYEKLYSKYINLKDPKEIFSLIKSPNCVDAEYNQICCQDITLEEIIWGITQLKQ